MKPITEEQRQTLINRIRNIKITGKANRFEISEIAEIAIASLTVEPFAYARRLIRIRDGQTEAFKITQTLAENTEGLIYRNEVEALYTTPPVPVIKFPDWCQKVPDGTLDINADLVRYHFMEEIKRLNRMEE